jgi:hypothetical protein
VTSSVHVRGNSSDPIRGSTCTPLYVAQAVNARGAFELDPFSNERSHIAAHHACWLERGDDGYGRGRAHPGSYFRAGPCLGQDEHNGVRGVFDQLAADESAWIQPDYARDEVLHAIRHYVHTRFVALLRFDPRPEWHSLVGEASEWIGVLSNSPGESSFEFELPPGIQGGGNTFPHALYARRYEDVTPEMRRLCVYPDGSARHFRKRSALETRESTAAFARRWQLTNPFALR